MLSFIPQLWHCSSCTWRGSYPVFPIEKLCDGLDELIMEIAEGHELCDGGLVFDLPPILPWPTCPKCKGHRFYVQDLPVKGSPAWEAAQLQ